MNDPVAFLLLYIAQVQVVGMPNTIETLLDLSTDFLTADMCPGIKQQGGQQACSL